MKIIYKLNEKMTLELENVSQKQAFEDLATASEVFNESKCGKCGSTDIQFVVRENSGNKFYEISCSACHARLSYGVHKVGGTLFPKRKNTENNSYLPDFGWAKYVKPTT